MTQFVQLVISGLMLGCIYGLIAMGFVIVFKATNVVNFAHASIVMLGAFLVAKWHHSLGFVGAAAAAAVACALAAAVLDFLFVRPLRTKARGDDVLAIMTIALNILLGTALVRLVGNDLLPSGAPWGAKTTDVFGARDPAGAHRGGHRRAGADGGLLRRLHALELGRGDALRRLGSRWRPR